MSEAKIALTVKVNNVRGLLEKSRKQIEMALPKHLTVEKMLRVVMTSVQQTPALLDCDVKSLIQAVIESAQLGLIPDGLLGHAHLVPFSGKVKLIAGYKGKIYLAENSERVRKISAHAVFSNDEFDYRYGLNEDLTHKPHRGQDRGELVAAYAVCWKTTGDPVFEVVEAADVLPIKTKALKNKKKPHESPWYTAPGEYPLSEAEMWRKTAINKLAKFIPQSPDLQRLAAREEALDLGIDLEEPIDLEEGKDFATEDLSDLEAKFNAALPADIDQEKLAEFMELIANREEVEIEEVKENAIKHIDLFLPSFHKWMAASTRGDTAEGGESPPLKETSSGPGTSAPQDPAKPPIPDEALYIDGDGFGIAIKEQTEGKWSAFRFKGAEGWRKVKGLAMCEERHEAVSKLHEMAARCKWTPTGPLEPPEAPPDEGEGLALPWEEEKTSPEPGGEPLSDLAVMEARLEQECAAAYANEGTPAFLVKARKVWWAKFRNPTDPKGFKGELPTLSFGHLSKWWDTRTASEKEEIIAALDDVQL